MDSNTSNTVAFGRMRRINTYPHPPIPSIQPQRPPLVALRHGPAEIHKPELGLGPGLVLGLGLRLGLLILPSNINKRTRRGARILDRDAPEGLPVSGGLGGRDAQCPDTGACATQGDSQVRRG